MSKTGKIKPENMVFSLFFMGSRIDEKRNRPHQNTIWFPKVSNCFIRDISPGHIVGEIKENAYEVNLPILCET